jgi:hypothetical protein
MLDFELGLVLVLERGLVQPYWKNLIFVGIGFLVHCMSFSHLL